MQTGGMVRPVMLGGSCTSHHTLSLTRGTHSLTPAAPNPRALPGPGGGGRHRLGVWFGCSSRMFSSTRPPDWPEDIPKKHPLESHPLGKRPLDALNDRRPGSLNGLGLEGDLRRTTLADVGPSAGDKKPEDWNDILNRWYQHYQDFIGITDLKRAQDRVTELSESLLDTQSTRRRLQAGIEDLQSRLVDNHQRITKTEQYSQDHLMLFNQAREMDQQLRDVRGEFLDCERMERDTFTQLSAAIRDCHERERMQAEQSKYWSIIASVVSAALASVITSINNWVRIKEIKEHVSATNTLLLDGYHQMHRDVLASLPTAATTTTAAATASPSSVTKEDLERLGERLATIFSQQPVTPPPQPTPGTQQPLGESTMAGAEVTYPRVAAAMVVGAGLGTLVTAFLLGALGGAGG